LRKVVETVRSKHGEKEIVLHYEDQAANEWKSVFKHVLGDINVQDAYGKTIETPHALGNVFVQACGVGFHSQCYPSNSIELALSFTAMHWLSASPNSLRGQTAMHAARCPIPPKAEKRQAAEDWEAILLARAKELVRGGRCVLVNFCVSGNGYFLGQTDECISMWDSFESSWNRLYEQGLIDEEERLGVSFPNYYRTKEEFLAGVEAVPELEVISCEEKIVRCPYRTLWLEGKTGKSAREYAEWFVPTTRSWSHSTFENALHKHRTDKKEVMDQFWKNYIDIVAADPDAHGMDYVHCYLVLEKV
jgi:hypothetical protein